jgi:hypothetical protein
MFEQYSTLALSKKIDAIQAKIVFYSDRDRVRMEQLESELKELQSQLLIQLSNENDIWLASHSVMGL